jgi:transcriptional regulator with XRE-family HTH domain
MSTLTVVPDQPDRLTETVAAEVRAHMARVRLNQTQLADALGLTQSSVSKRLRGVVAFNTDELAKVAGVLGVHPAVLLGGQPSYTPQPTGGNTGKTHRQSNTLSSAAKVLTFPVASRSTAGSQRPTRRVA